MAKPSAESLSIATVSIPVRPDAPEDLTPFQKKLWDQVTSTKPPEWFEEDTLPILRAYVVAAERHYRVSKELDGMSLADPDAQTLLKTEDQQAKLMKQMAVSMRLTQQSRYTPQAAATANKKAASGKKPWE